MHYSYFGARFYTSDLGVWLSVDPLSDKYPSLSPYAYVANNPILFVDPDGREIDWNGNFWGSMRALFSHLKTKEGRSEWRKMKNDNSTLYSFKFHRTAAIGNREDGTCGLVEGAVSVNDVAPEGYESKQTINIFLGTYKIEKKARSLAGVENLYDLPSELRSNAIHQAMEAKKKIKIFNIHANEFEKGGIITFSSHPRIPRPLNSEKRGEFVHRVLIHEGIHALMNSGVLYQNHLHSKNPEFYPWSHESQAMLGLRKLRLFNKY